MPSDKPKLSLLQRFFRIYTLNTLASLWYCLVTVSFQIFLIIRAIHRFSAYISLPWPNGRAPVDSVNIYMLSVAVAILIIPFFIIACWTKIGNYSNDGRKLGSFDIRKYIDYLRQDDDEDVDGGGDRCHSDTSIWSGHHHHLSRWWKIFWRHSLPIGPTLHLLVAICFLLPNLITEAQLIRHGFLGKADIWKTDLDFLFRRFNGKIFQFFGLVQTINVTEHRYIFTDSSTLGHYFIRNSKSLSETFYELDQSGHFSPELLNLMVALVVITARYPAVFWRVNKSFSLILTFQLILNSLQSIVAVNAFQVAFKMFVCDPTHLLIRFRESSSLNLFQLSTLMLVYLIVLHFSTVSVYIYGLHKYREYRYARTKYFQNKYEDFLLVNLLPYLFAMLFFLMLAVSVGPLYFEFAIIYCGSLSFSALLILISTIIYFACWIFLWILLATKTVWNFHYDDIESSKQTDGKSTEHPVSLLITNDGRVFRIKDDLATMTIINFIQSNGFEKAAATIYNKTGTKQCNQQKQQYHGSLNRKFRHSTRTVRPKDSAAASCTVDMRLFNGCGRQPQDDNHTDSDGEYTTFHRLKRSYSLNHQKKSHHGYVPVNRMPSNEIEMLNVQNKKNSTLLSQTNQPLPAGPTSFTTTLMSNNAAYGLMCNNNTMATMATTATNHDRISDISSGFHSDGSQSPLTSTSSSGQQRNNDDADQMMNRSNSLESLLQRIEAAASSRPHIRSLTPLQKTCADLASATDGAKMASGDEYKTFVTTGEKIKNPVTESKLMEFVENPDYSKYYLPHVVVMD